MFRYNIKVYQKPKHSQSEERYLLNKIKSSKFEKVTSENLYKKFLENMDNLDENKIGAVQKDLIEKTVIIMLC